MLCFNRQFSLSNQPLHPLPLPPRGETHLWYIIPDEIKSTSLLKQYHDILSPSEKKSVLSFQEDEVRKKALLARALVRTTIARYQTNSFVDPRSLKFKKNSYGKPEVDWQDVPDMSWPPLHFNLSHSASLIACGITTYSPIGIDVEDKNRTTKNDVISFASRFFSPWEVDHLANISELELQRQEFIKLWTLKEAYVKALGRAFRPLHLRASGFTSKLLQKICLRFQKLLLLRNQIFLLNHLSLKLGSGSWPFLTWMILIMLLFAHRMINSVKVWYSFIKLTVSKHGYGISLVDLVYLCRKPITYGFESVENDSFFGRYVHFWDSFCYHSWWACQAALIVQLANVFDDKCKYDEISYMIKQLNTRGELNRESRKGVI